MTKPPNQGRRPNDPHHTASLHHTHRGGVRTQAVQAASPEMASPPRYYSLQRCIYPTRIRSELPDTVSDVQKPTVFICLFWFLYAFETKSHYVALTVLELTM